MNKIIGISGMGLNREIGQEGKLPWEDEAHKGLYRDDMVFFSKSTKNNGNGHPVIMASKTWKSFDDKYKPLPGRPNIVVTSQSAEQLPLPEGVYRASSIENAIEIAMTLPNSEKIFLCGGASLYQWAVENANELWLTEIPEAFPKADTFFPEFLTNGWVEFERTISPNNQCEFVKYHRE